MDHNEKQMNDYLRPTDFSEALPEEQHTETSSLCSASTTMSAQSGTDSVAVGTDSDGAASQDPAAERRRSIQLCIQSLMHACQCYSKCQLPKCQQMKRVMAHVRSCRNKAHGGCPVCKQLIALCCYHAKYCPDTKCRVPYCIIIKRKLRQQIRGSVRGSGGAL